MKPKHKAKQLTMGDIGHIIESSFNPSPKERKIGFFLMVFPVNQMGGQCRFVSSAMSKGDIKDLLEGALTIIDKNEGKVSRSCPTSH